MYAEFAKVAKEEGFDRIAFLFEEVAKIEKEIEVTEYLATIENFFPWNGVRTHEIQFVYRAEFMDEKDKKLQETIKNKEGNNNIQYEWLDLNNLDEYPIKPKYED